MRAAALEAAGLSEQRARCGPDGRSGRVSLGPKAFGFCGRWLLSESGCSIYPTRSPSRYPSIQATA